MKEESHLEEMRAALRGDRERAERARQRSTENVRALLDVPEPEITSEPAAEPTRQSRLARVFGR
ncbi:MAG TPA: hypothetical protein VM184_06295 [Gaiellaceae bacterium]|nr:hypothetical protein [Gaiellaceae bacterium]